MLGHRLISLHNLHHYASLMASARKAISEGQVEDWVQVMSQRDSAAVDSEGS
ncbi:MAG: hypothetical protein ABI895_42330 [Deltaproteobacteria bacterium]